MPSPAFTLTTPLRLSTSAKSFLSSRHPPTLRESSFLPAPPSILQSFPLLSKSSFSSPSIFQMSLSKVVIAGGTGFIGTNLSKTLLSQNSSVTILTRKPTSSSSASGPVLQTWPAMPSDGSAAWEDVLLDADLVINLCGFPVVSRWNAKGKELIEKSRVDTTRALVEAIKRMDVGRRPKCFIGGSAVGIYGVSSESQFDESSEAAKGDFLGELCVKWERETTEGLRGVNGVRVAVVRIGVVMGVGGGALERMIPAFKFFAGGPVGSGEQWVSWVHIEDLVRVFIEVAENEQMSGVYNATAPKAVRMGELAAALGRALGRPSLFPVPGFVLKAAFGEGAQVVLDGQRVIPKRLMEGGFQFMYGDIDSAMKAVAEVA